MTAWHPVGVWGGRSFWMGPMTTLGGIFYELLIVAIVFSNFITHSIESAGVMLNLEDCKMYVKWLKVKFRDDGVVVVERSEVGDVNQKVNF